MRLWIWAGLLAVWLTASACGGGRGPVLRVAGIPDQDASRLARRYQALTSYLEARLGVPVEYVATVDYAATVAAFQRGEIDVAWFGGLTGVQARAAVPGSEAIAQRARDAQFRSVFIVDAGVEARRLEDLRGLSFTFGSESSTSGHLMPRYFLLQAGIDPERDLKGPPGYSGSHDRTWKLVEAGAFQAGALNEAVWDRAVAEGRVDLGRVRELLRTPPYPDYNWTVRADIEEKFGPGFKERLKEALLSIGPSEREILELFNAQKFIEARNEDYEAIRRVAQELGILRR